MQYLLILMVIICIILVILLVSDKKELTHLYQQLEHIEDGSQIELTTKVASKTFIKIYQKLNRMFSHHRQQQQEQLVEQQQLRQAIANIAHDIRTPLTSASGYMQMLSECQEEIKRERYQNIISQRLQELKEMLAELFLYTKLSNPDYTLECVRTAVFPIFSNSLVSLYHLFEEQESQPEIKFADENIYLNVNADGLDRVFRNLIQNALMHGSGLIQIQQQGNMITFQNQVPEGIILDTEKLFERYYKADSTRQKGSSGLGLAIVKELMTRMNGTVGARLDENILSVTLVFAE